MAAKRAKPKAVRLTLPTTLYVKNEDDGDGGTYPAMYNSPELALDGDSVRVGVYKLEKVVTVTRKIVVTE
jgi:hypothetical protein